MTKKKENEELLKRLLDILDCEANLMEYERIIEEKGKYIDRLCIPNPPARPVFLLPEKPEPPKEPERKEVKTNKGALVLGAIIGLVFSLLGGGFNYGNLISFGEKVIPFIVAAGIIPLFSACIFAGVVAIVGIIREDLNLSKIRKINKARYAKELNAHEKLVEWTKDKHKKDLKIWEEDLEKDKQRVRRELAVKVNCQQEIKDIETLSGETKNTLSLLYKTSLLAPRYQNLIATAKIYEYMSEGLTHSLERTGNDPGAYNMLRDDTRDAKQIAAILLGALAVSKSVGKASKDISTAIGTMGYQISGSINNMRSSLSNENRELRNAVEEGNNRSYNLLGQISDNQNTATLIQQEMLRQERIQTLAHSSGPYQKVYNKDGYRVD